MYFNHFLFLKIFLLTSVSSKKRVGLFLILNKKTSSFRKVFLIFFENSTSVSFRLFLVGYNGCNDLHHEIELGVVVGKQAKKVAEREAMGYVGGYCLALDMTARF